MNLSLSVKITRPTLQGSEGVCKEALGPRHHAGSRPAFPFCQRARSATCAGHLPTSSFTVKLVLLRHCRIRTRAAGTPGRRDSLGRPPRARAGDGLLHRLQRGQNRLQRVQIGRRLRRSLRRRSLRRRLVSAFRCRRRAPARRNVNSRQEM